MTRNLSRRDERRVVIKGDRHTGDGYSLDNTYMNLGGGKNSWTQRVWETPVPSKKRNDKTPSYTTIFMLFLFKDFSVLH